MISESFQAYILKKYRWILVIVFLLPLTFLYEIYSLLRHYIVEYFKDKSEDHLKKVKAVQAQVLEWNKGDKSQPMCTGRPGWKSMTLREPKYKSSMFNVFLDNLDSVLEIDSTAQTILVEPYVSMGQLTSYLIPKGWTIPVVIELDDVTVGGIVLGQGLESSSHKYGMFQNTCVSYEMVLSDGSVVRCTKDNDPDLFHAIPWSYGTLGFLTSVEIQIIPVKKYVQIQYIALKTLSDLEHHLKKESENLSNDFVEAIMFTKDQSVLMIGTFTNDADSSKVNSIGLWYKPWFFQHVKIFLLKKRYAEEFIPTIEYYHRHTRSLFWEIQDIVPFGNNVLFRYLLGWLMPPKISFLKLTQTQSIKTLYDKHHVVEDFLVPMQELKPFVEYLHQHIQIYPLWICPFLLKNVPGLVHPSKSEDALYVDVGLYGEPKVGDYDSVTSIKAVENYLGKMKGFQMLYAGVFQSQSEFRHHYDHTLYDKIRSKLKSEKSFPEIYGKVNRKVRD